MGLNSSSLNRSSGWPARIIGPPNCARKRFRSSAEFTRTHSNNAKRTWAHPLASSFRYHRASDAAPERSVGSLPALPGLRHHKRSGAGMGIGLCFGIVEQSQAGKLAVPLLRSAALLLRRRLSASSRSSATWATRDHASRLRKPVTAEIVASLRLYLHRRSPP
jgi:hypothetical protein